MESLIRPIYYTLIFFTGVLNVFYLWSGIMTVGEDHKMMLIKRLMGLGAAAVIYLLYKAYLAGEISGNFQKGILLILSCWLTWIGSAALGFLLVRIRG